MASAQLHVTAAFLGAVNEARLAELRELCGPVEPLTINFDRLEHWAKPRVLVASTTHLAEDVRTVRPGLPWRPQPWPVDRLRLVESVPGPGGVRYEPCD